ncbi:MAG: hypothetical protein GC159_00405 [Phycisphaera sp.]|nr:hypothetical protein [Phycisphaera sp.]
MILGIVVILAAVMLFMNVDSKGTDEGAKPEGGTTVAATAPASTEPATTEPATTEPAATEPAATGGDSKEEMEVLELDLPNPVFAGTPQKIPAGVRIDKKRHGKERPPYFVPKGLNLKNVADGKAVTSSDANPIIGSLDLVTDGDKEALDGRYVELAPGKQWLQIDLGKEQEIWVIMLWHNHLDPRVYKDVVVQISNDPEFKDGVTTVFNNDHDNSSGFGVGEDYEYFEHAEGELIPVKGKMARYVRCWSNGSTADDQNHYTEVEVFAKTGG